MPHSPYCVLCLRVFTSPPEFPVCGDCQEELRHLTPAERMERCLAVSKLLDGRQWDAQMDAIRAGLVELLEFLQERLPERDEERDDGDWWKSN